MHRLWYFLLLFLSVVIQQLFFAPLGSFLWGEPLLPIVVLVILSTATGSITAESMGFFVGLLWNFTEMDTGLPQGMYSLLLTLIAFVLGRLLHDRFKAPKTLLLAICTALSVLSWSLASIALKLIVLDLYLPDLLEFIQVVLNTIYSVLLCFLINPLLRKFLVRWEWNGSF